MPKTFTQPIQISDIDGRSSETIDALVNAGAFFTTIPADTLTRLGITPTNKRKYVRAGGSRIERDTASAWVIVGESKVPTTIFFGANDAQPMLGEHTLEGLGLEVDEPNAQLVEMQYLFAASPIAIDRGV